MANRLSSSSSPASPSSKHGLKFTICCFRSVLVDDDDEEEEVVVVYSKSPRSWLKRKAHDLKIKERCRGLIGMRGKCRRRHNSGDFSYDATSYWLNFENKKQEEDVVLHGFVSRLPLTPPRTLILNSLC